ncbi:hypothetical protein VDGD_21765 [Verticillium dahliae]|nr:hypothetical protein VDGD_21765 [Verticillium dahliae]
MSGAVARLVNIVGGVVPALSSSVTKSSTDNVASADLGLVGLAVM